MSDTPNLNWKEIADLVQLLRPDVEGAYVDKVVVPARPRFPGGYLKGEWLLRLNGRRKQWGLVLSVRARHPYISLYSEREIPKATAQATRSTFDLSLAKHLKGARIETLYALARERTVVFTFSGDEKFALLISMIPAVPEALLVSTKDCPWDGPWPILARSRAKENDARLLGDYVAPDGAKAPPNPPLRPEWQDWMSKLSNWVGVIEAGLDSEAFALRKLHLERDLREKLKHAEDQIRSNAASVDEAKGEADWGRFGGLLKASLPDPGPIVAGAREVHDFETDEKVRIPADPKLSPREQVEKFFRLEKRKQKRLEEAQARLALFQESRERFRKLSVGVRTAADWKALDLAGEKSGAAAGGTRASQTREKKSASSHAWQGPAFVSKDGMTIWVGRNRTENLELTFKHTRGNDLWLHVRGRPGAHVVVPISSGKSAPLETLLDAAVLAVFYSGGEKWGKTEVDYTFKKYVKRIKDSSEASYTNNKTLFVEPDPVRLKRLMAD